MAAKKKTTKKRKSSAGKSLKSCSGAGYALKKSSSNGVKSAAGRKLSSCKTGTKKTTSKSKPCCTITQLRNKFPKSKLRYREKDILFGAGAKITKAKDYPDGIYRVIRGSNYFLFAYKSSRRPDWTILG